MRIRLKPAILISNDPEAKYRLFAPDETLVERVIETYTKQFSGIATVVAAATEALSLGDVTLVRGMWLSVNKDCQVKLNGGSALQLRKPTVAAGDDKAAFVIEAEITSIEIIAGVDPVEAIYTVWGDAAP